MASGPRLIALNVALCAGLALIVWQGRVRWDEARDVRRATVNVPLQHVIPPPPMPAQKPDAVQAAKYSDVASKNLFSKDRNPTVIVDAPKVEAPKVMPPLPVIYGVLTLSSGTKAMMAERSGATSRSIQAGDSIGDFKILALDSRKVTFEWDGKQLERNIDDLLDRSGGAGGSQAGGQSVSSGPAAPPPAASAPVTSAVLGTDSGTAEAPTRTCKAGDNSPVGTVVDGYKKAGTASPFGVMGCMWVQSK